MHDSNLSSHRHTRSVLGDQGDVQRKILEVVERLELKVDYLTERARAAELGGVDSTAIGIPWRSAEEVSAGLSTPAKVQAFYRILKSPILFPTKAHFMADVIEVFFTPEFRGRGYIKKPSG